jgi:type II secretory pathway component GspD/PulD (secretin)
MKAKGNYSFLAGLLMSIAFTGAALADQLQPTAPSQPSALATNTAATAVTVDRSTNGVRLNFRGASLRQVLDYLSEAAGFIINNQTEVSGAVEMWSQGPVTRDEAVELLNSVLKPRGCTVIRNGRILTIVNLDGAKTADLEVVTGNNPDAVQKSEAVVTQIISVRYADASRLVNNLQPLLPAMASLSVNESANALILVDNQTAIRRMLKIISALDSSAARSSSLKVFPLRYANATELAPVVQQMFSTADASQSSGGANSAAQSFGPPGGGFGPSGSEGLLGSQAGSGSAGGTASAPKLVAIADERANSLIVSASPGLIPAVTALVQQLDQQVNDVTAVRLFRLRNADPAELADQLAQLYPDDSGTGSGQSQAAFGFGGPPSPPGAGPDAETGNLESATGERRKKQAHVLAVADPRSSSLLVSAGSALMPQIAALIAQLDADSGRKEIVSYWDLRNADPQDVKQILQDLFNRNTTAQNNNNNALLGQNNPLTVRQTQQQNSTTTSTLKLGSSGSGGSSGSSTGL